MLVRPDGVVIEVHTTLPGVEVGRGGDAGFARLEGASLVEKVGSLPGSCFVPSHELLVAHCLVHGLVQHGSAPLAYPGMRMLADLIDLGLAGPRGEELAGRAHALVERQLLRGEVASAVTLCRALVAGEGASLLCPGAEDGPARLLRHVLAGPVDERYRDALRWRAISGLDGPPRSLHGWVDELRQAVLITRGQVEVMHGPQRNEWGYVFWRVVRPLQLLVRLPRYAVGALWHRMSVRRHAT